MSRPKRHYLVDGQWLTPAKFKRISKARKVEAMRDWFLSRFEDPAHETPYNVREGGYQYINGGPFDADDEIQNEFMDLVDYDLMQEAVDEVTSDGVVNWAPIRSEPDYDRVQDDDIVGVDQPLPDWAFDVPEDEQDVDAPGDLRADVLAGLERFEAKLDAYVGSRAHRGHNQPPELVDDEDQVTGEDVGLGRVASSEIRAEVQKDQPDAGIITRAAAILATFGRKLRGAAKILAGDLRAGLVGAGAALAIDAYREELASAAFDAANLASRLVEHLPFW